jgi:predicted nucleotidyltransferase
MASRRCDVVAAIQDKLDAIADLCRKHGVVQLYVFGSAIRDDFRPGESDLDLLVDFGAMGGHAKAHAYFGLLDELEGLLGARVDLVMVNAVKNRYIARDIERTKQMLYAV